ncbi:3-keto-5-aminohexanoate cleavage protein [uncultured Kiloniella sp.]|uniref:3-keto-5-aminohexanoate cleavage protein n=1 Tax=uncultured Kiloniella sp. TaxID=1133091 RepID=UPI00262C324C|nr:3-keto-5-aminohexanoate cleavage protein [uncultured Kiloniella sp.]
MSKIIISCAITGSIHTPSMSPYLPVTGEEIAAQSIASAEAGAAIIHLHARDPETGKPSSSYENFMGFLPDINRQSDAVLNLSTGGSALMSLEDRLAAPLQIEPEMCSLNMGSMNFALYPIAERIKDWKHDWEKSFLMNSDDLVFKNTPRDIAFILAEMGEKRGTRFEFECYDLGHLYMLEHFVSRGLVRGPLFIQFVFGVLGGMGADPENLTHMKRMADKLFGDNYAFSILAAGRHQMRMAAMSAAMGGHVRVGLEDNLTIAKGELAVSNAQQVVKVREIVENLGREVATADDARSLLQLKGKNDVRLQAAGAAFDK